jgi:hypothetical protein
MNPDAPPVDGLIDAIHQQHWPIVVGFVIAILIYAANHAGLQDRVGAKWVPRIAMGSGILSAIGAQLVLGIPWEEAVSKGFLAGATATGLWETLLKDMLPKVPVRTATPAPAAVEAPKATTPKAAKAVKVVAPEVAPAADVPVKVKKKPGPKPGTKRVKAETVVGAPVTPEAAPVAPETAPATVEEPKAPEAVAEAPVSPPPAEPTP